MAFLAWQLWHSKVMLTMSANWWRSWYFRCDGVGITPRSALPSSPLCITDNIEKGIRIQCQSSKPWVLYPWIETSSRQWKCTALALHTMHCILTLYTGIVAPRVGSRTPGPLMYARKTYLQCNDGNARWHTGFQNAFARLLWSEHPPYLPSSLATLMDLHGGCW